MAVKDRPADFMPGGYTPTVMVYGGLRMILLGIHH
jgi:hypothetical protein